MQHSWCLRQRPLSARLPIPLPLFHITFYIGACKVDNYHDRIVIILGLADRRSALVNEFSGPLVDRVDLNLGMTAVPDILKECDFRHNKTQDRHRKGGSTHKRLPLVNRENRSEDLQVQL